jgi:hypothetical protein
VQHSKWVELMKSKANAKNSSSASQVAL